MPKFSYTAINAAGTLIRGSVFEMDELSLEQELSRKGITLVSSKQKGLSSLSNKKFSDKIPARMIIELYHRISQTLELGLSILDVLKENAKVVKSKSLKRILEEIQVSIKNGNTLADSMAKFPKNFGKLDIALIRLGEQSGVLPNCLKDLSEFLEWKEDLKSTIHRAAIYPSFILIAIGGVLGVWVGYVLPQMEELLLNLGTALPAITLFVLNSSRFLQEWWLYIIAGFVGFIAGMLLFKKTPVGLMFFHKYLLKIPLLGVVSSNIAVARLSHNFAAMYRAGMTINQIFDVLTEDVVGNVFLEEKLKKAYADIQRGESIAGALEKNGGFSELLVGAVRNGETTGTIDDSFSRLGKYYDAEVKRTVETLISAMEPISIVMLGGVFGMIALSILLPLYDVIGKIN
ncbi:MAG: type II secretion system F family protein [Proteobacteria bacterium]|nr:type II secretion system F family protein [Pseudomonadota bacterium]MBU4469811.1 type II secretion system F family protein [Pseudomonadota bacterium]MCG2753046.1 type II secretion system F family protein [Desulfobacteraceae bacterium]